MKNYAKIAVFVLGFMLYSWTSLGQESFNVGAQQNNLEKQDSLKTRIEQELSANKQVSDNRLSNSVKEHNNVTVTKEDIYKIIDTIFIYFNEEQKAKVGELKDFINTVPDEFNTSIYNELVALEALAKKAYPEMSK